jgi:hypothetical protein
VCRVFPQALAKLAPRKRWREQRRADHTRWSAESWTVCVHLDGSTRVTHTGNRGSVVKLQTRAGPSAAVHAATKALALLEA